MKAFILAAGLGTRLAPLTDKTPKCLITVAGKTMLERTVEGLKAVGVNSVVINLHHLAQQVTEYVKEKNNFGLEVHFSEEKDLLGTGGGVRKAAALFNGEKDFIVHNSDVYSETDLAALLDQHHKNKNIATLAVMQRQSSRQLIFDENFQLVGWDNGEKKEYRTDQTVKTQNFAFTGIQVVSAGIFSYMEALGDSFSIISAYMQAVRAGERVAAFNIQNAYWIDMGNAKNLAELERKLS